MLSDCFHVYIMTDTHIHRHCFYLKAYHKYSHNIQRDRTPIASEIYKPTSIYHAYQKCHIKTK